MREMNITTTVMKSKIQRKCIVTNQVKPVEELVRIAKQKSGIYHVDSDAKGRGAYVTRDVSLADKILQKRVLHRSFKENVPNEVYEELIRKLKEEENGR